MKPKQGYNKLTGKDLRFLRGLGHHLKPLVIIGREGISDNVIKAVNGVLAAHELVKVKIGRGCLMGRKEAAEEIAAGTGSEVVQVLGKTFLIYRENSDLKDDHRIKLPR
ncbi:MAG: ribosome assembly RNA-binding protein YhbY [Desulfobulbales bacterium]|nr:ribosome assembly RNA-binding protein YhbY [Desulfobulbales bacterium]